MGKWPKHIVEILLILFMGYCVLNKDPQVQAMVKVSTLIMGTAFIDKSFRDSSGK